MKDLIINAEEEVQCFIFRQIFSSPSPLHHQIRRPQKSEQCEGLAISHKPIWPALKCKHHSRFRSLSESDRVRMSLWTSHFVNEYDHCRLNLQGELKQILDITDSKITNLEFFPNQGVLLILSAQEKLYVFSVEQMFVSRVSINMGRETTLLHIPKVIDLTNNFAYIGCKDGEVMIYDYQEHLILDYCIPIRGDPRIQKSEAVSAIQRHHKDETKLMIAYETCVMIWNMTKQKSLLLIEAKESWGRILNVHWAPDESNNICVAASLGIVAIYKLKGKEPFKIISLYSLGSGLSIKTTSRSRKDSSMSDMSDKDYLVIETDAKIHEYKTIELAWMKMPEVQQILTIHSVPKTPEQFQKISLYFGKKLERTTSNQDQFMGSSAIMQRKTYFLASHFLIHFNFKKCLPAFSDCLGGNIRRFLEQKHVSDYSLVPLLFKLTIGGSIAYYNLNNLLLNEASSFKLQNYLFSPDINSKPFNYSRILDLGSIKAESRLFLRGLHDYWRTALLKERARNDVLFALLHSKSEDRGKLGRTKKLKTKLLMDERGFLITQFQMDLYFLSRALDQLNKQHETLALLAFGGNNQTLYFYLVTDKSLIPLFATASRGELDWEGEELRKRGSSEEQFLSRSLSPYMEEDISTDDSHGAGLSARSAKLADIQKRRKLRIDAVAIAFKYKLITIAKTDLEADQPYLTIYTFQGAKKNTEGMVIKLTEDKEERPVTQAEFIEAGQGLFLVTGHRDGLIQVRTIHGIEQNIRFTELQDPDSHSYFSAISTLSSGKSHDKKIQIPYLYAGSRNGLILKINAKLLSIDVLTKSPLLELKPSDLQEQKMSPEILKIGELKAYSVQEWCQNLLYLIYRKAVFLITADTLKEKNLIFLKNSILMFQVVVIEKALHFILLDDANNLVILLARTLTRVHLSNQQKLSEMVNLKILDNFIVSTGSGQARVQRIQFIGEKEIQERKEQEDSGELSDISSSDQENKFESEEKKMYDKERESLFQPIKKKSSIFSIFKRRESLRDTCKPHSRLVNRLSSSNALKTEESKGSPSRNSSYEDSRLGEMKDNLGMLQMKMKERGEALEHLKNTASQFANDSKEFYRDAKKLAEMM